MNSEHADLWQRIHSFSFDGPGPAPLTFSARLARDNGWTRDFANQAILEYKRFVFLAMAAGHPVCPPEQVDQVWHLHLTYTRSYWGDLCKNVLGQSLHHDPTRGGPAEAIKHGQMYAQTLASYRRLFGSDAPTDFWPPANIRFGDDVQPRQVSTRPNWIVPNNPLRRAAAFATLMIALCLVSGCIGPIIAGGGIDGPTYLLLYLAVFVGVTAAAMVVRNKMRKPTDLIDIDPAALDCYDLALLAGGPRRVFDTAVLRLIHTGCLKYDSNGNLEILRLPEPPEDPIESAIVTRITDAGGASRSLADIRKGIQLDLVLNKERLIEKELFLDERQSTRIRNRTFFPVLFIPLCMALPRIIGGFENRAPTCFLACLGFVSLIIAIVAFGRTPRRTIRGDLYLEQRLREPRSITTQDGRQGYDLVLATALLGTAVLAGTEYDALRRDLYPKGSDSSSSGGCSSSCGSGCGAGGGGGGCGGGCGGGD